MVVANRAHANVPKVYQYPGRGQQPNTKQQRRSVAGTNASLVRRVMLGLLIVGLALLVVYRYGQISQINMELNNLNRTRNAIVDEHRHLEITAARLTALDRLERIGLEELGMQYPHPGQIRYVGNYHPERGDGDGN